MKINKALTALIAGASIGLSGQAMAVGTVAGTEIQNKVTLSYEVDSTLQDTVSNTAQFKVDNKIDMALSWDDTGALKGVAPGKTVFHKFTLTNTGNLDQPYNLSASVAASGTTIFTSPSTVTSNTDATPAPTFTFYSQDLAPTEGVDTPITALASVPHTDALDANKKIFWVGVNYPLTANLEDENKLGNYVTATADVSGNGNDADSDKNTNLEKQLFVNADGVGADPTDLANDAKISAVFGDEITTANFSDVTDGLKLSVKVVNDPICNTDDSNYGILTNHASGTTGLMLCASASAPGSYIPKAIPGALLEYTITAKNTGRSQAELVGFSQDLSSLKFDGATASTSLKSASIDHVVATMANNNSVAAVVTANSSALDVDVATFDADASITITFTAIVD